MAEVLTAQKVTLLDITIRIISADELKGVAEALEYTARGLVEYQDAQGQKQEFVRFVQNTLTLETLKTSGVNSLRQFAETELQKLIQLT